MQSSLFLYCLLLFALVLVGRHGTLAAVPRRRTVLVVGGSSGMGKAAALEILRHQDAAAAVVLVSRSAAKLEDAKKYLVQKVMEEKRVTKDRGDCLDTDGDTNRMIAPSIHLHVCDITQESQVQALATILEQMAKAQNHCFTGLVVTAAGKAAHGPVLTLPTEDARDLLDSKLWGAYQCAKYLAPLLADGSGIVFCAGILNRRPGIHCAPLAMANGALEGLTKALALEWGPRLRVNCLSPGFCDTERFDAMDSVRKQAMLDNTAASLPLQRVGQPEDMGRAIYYLLNAPFCTGVILDVDGGHGIRQYAQSSSDPMRNKQ